MPRNFFVQISLLALTYQANVKPILDQNCSECHHPGGRSPTLTSFPFYSPSTWDQGLIVERLLLQTDQTTGHMPPGHRPKVSATDRATIQAWKDQGLAP